MITTNLSTRPFYNERLIALALGTVLVLAVAASVFNVTRVVRLSRNDTQLGTQAARDEARAADLRAQAARLRASVDPGQVAFASSEARRANDLIDRRTFSWTELFNRFETTLPDEVRIVAVRPTLDRARGIVLAINVVARNNDDISQFIEKLEATGAFRELLSRDERYNEQGQLEASLESVYVPSSAAPAGNAEGGGR